MVFRTAASERKMQNLASNRLETVLSTVIHQYVATAKPVASQTLTDKMQISSATIRNVFMSLEDQGYLTHPHTSAGRVPTEQGYRFYVDHLMKARELNLKEKQLIEHEYEKTKNEVETLIRHTAKILSAMTHLGGLAVFHLRDEVQLDHFKLVAIDSKKIMVILVMAGGLIKEELVRLEAPLSLKELSKVTQLLNSRYAGMSLTQIKEILLKEAERVKNDRLSIVEAALKAIDGTLDLNHEDIRLEGASHLMEQPEFKNVESLERMVRLVDERKPLMRVLDRQWAKPGLSIEIGQESDLGLPLDGFSVVHVPYRFKGQVAGALGVWGPIRMDYERIAGLVNHLAHSLEDAFNKQGGWS
jgi:heat-inducible transcriptional repressor